MLALARGYDIARASSDKVVVGGSVAAHTIHRPIGVGVATDGRDKVIQVDHWMIPFWLKLKGRLGRCVLDRTGSSHLPTLPR